MNSVKKKSATKQGSLYRIDSETGKQILLPAPWFFPSKSSAIGKLSDKKMNTVPLLTPLKLTAADFEDPPCTSAKMRKMDHNSVRKGLFNVPSIKLTRPSAGRRSLSKRSTGMKKVQQRQNNPSQLSPLLDMEEVEEELLSKKRFLHGYPFKTPKKPSIKFSKDVKCSPLTRKVKLEKNTPRNNAEKASESISSNDTEFLELENMCHLNKPDEDKYNQSPISSVCNLLEGTMLNSNKKQKITSESSTDIETVISDIQNLLEENKTAVEQYKISHKETLDKISDLLETQDKKYEHFVTVQEEFSANVRKKLKCLCPNRPIEEDADNKENSPVHNRRSVRLLRKNPLQSTNRKLIVSPVIMKSGDLRKTTLTKNLVTKSQQYQVESPRIQKALNAYNSMRNDISILATPKMRKGLFESPKSSSLSRILSTTIQNQCLLLQDTPVHRK